ncbi:MAG: hypothetical protein IKJ59_10265 [Clostridia bacterium]|nr:hypothetical protein [Clostridia bacterium]
MKIEVSKNSLSNRRLFIKNKKELISFADSYQLDKIQLINGFTAKSIEEIPEDIVSVGTHALRLTSDGNISEPMKFSYSFDIPQDLSTTPMLYFAYSAYDGKDSSKYFSDVKENKYFVEKPDPLLVNCSYITVVIHSGAAEAKRTIQLTDYGFNRIFANFAGEPILGEVDKITFEYVITDPAPAWQKICKLDSVFCGMSVDYTFKGSGMDCLFATESGSVIHKNDVIYYDYEANSSLTFPDMTDAAQTICEAFLPIKNTLVLRIEADKSDEDIKVYFKTDEENEFSEDKSKTFALKGINTAQTVYLNMSDHPKYKGRLTGIKIKPLSQKGSMKIYKLAFEQEKKIEPIAGYFTSCTADSETVYFTCDINPEYIGKKVEIYEVFPAVIHENLAELECVCSAIADSKELKLTTNMRKEKTTRIASQFMGIIHNEDGTYHKFYDRTIISNWRDHCGENPYEFELPEYSVCVTDPEFGAKGDGFTDDTKAIQAAINRVANQGGGTVIVPGDNSEYGKRYIVTNLVLHSYVELHIAENAILWQADDISYYDVLPRFGHNVSMTGVNWPANHTTGNMPMIYAFRKKNVKITGPGMLRMCDTESASEDGYFKYIGDNVCIGCCDRMHVCPVAIVDTDHFEISDLKIIRSSGVYININHNKNGFIGNVFMDESKCTGADGMWPLGSDGIKITRVILNNNDDGICLSSNYNDPRDVLWVFAHPGRDRGTHNIELSHSMFNCYTFTASAVSFCTWGTDSPDLGKQEVSGIHIFDTILEGRLAIGGWTDNPYYGKSPFDASEQDDFSPVKDVHIHDCEMKSPVGISPLRITNCLNDIGYRSPSNFEYGNFLRRPAERNEGWVTGLANWSYNKPECVSQITFLGDSCACIVPSEGDPCKLYQGLYLEKGNHTFEFDYKASGTFYPFVNDAATGKSVAKSKIVAAYGGYTKGKDWKKGTLSFNVAKDGLYHIGIECNYEETIGMYFTNCNMVHASQADDVHPTETTEVRGVFREE